MASLSKFNAALLTIPNELTVAAASLNFDFSLYKIEAPKEYTGLGDSLTKWRREQAEEGQIHWTARKLGALFESLIPEMPHLIGAYGKRVSDISKQAPVDSTATQSPFSDYSGLDGTSIWAAATSGRGALSVHLLACMLARMWSAPEAISIWVELVARRKQSVGAVLNDSEQSTFDIPTIVAARQDFPRSQLAAWDASARSWIQTADRIKMSQQTQLMLILNNITLPINRIADVHDSIAKAWIGAMSMMEALLKGMPQRVDDGAILLGISSWHLYPSMFVTGTTGWTEIDQDDNLFQQNALLTVGLQGCDTSTDSGLSWSLPLSHMQFYSEPVHSQRRLASDTTRISIEQLMFVVLGSTVAAWVTRDQDPMAVIRCLLSLKRHLLLCRERPIPPWLEMIFNVAQEYLDSSGPEQELAKKLLSFGIRKGTAFLLPKGSRTPPPLFGMTRIETILACAKTSEEKVRILRCIFERRRLVDSACQNKDILIRYRTPRRSVESHHERDEFTLLSAVALPQYSNKWMQDGAQGEQKHVRWLYVDPRKEPQASPDQIGDNNFVCDATHCGCAIGSARGTVCFYGDLGGCVESCHSDGSVCSISYEPEHYRSERCCIPRKPICGACRMRKRVSHVRQLGEDCHVLPIQSIHQHEDSSFKVSLGEPWAESYEYYVGDPLDVAVFLSGHAPKSSAAINTIDSSTVMIQELEYIVALGLLDPALVLSFFEDKRGVNGTTVEGRDSVKNQSESPSKMDSAREKLIDILEVLVAVKRLYFTMPRASISLTAFKKPLANYRWSTLLRILSADVLNPEWRSAAFACIGMLESDGFDIDPCGLKDVMAMAVGESIYVAAPLIEDPMANFTVSPIRRILGNVGRSGISLLHPPSQPRVARNDNGLWHLINHSPWDGRYEDSFASTSVHLSFTGSDMPMNVGSRGLRDVEVTLLETLISVFDKDQWIADLDVLSMFRKPYFKKAIDCAHGQPTERGVNPLEQRSGSSAMPFVVTIDNWAEYLDLPYLELGIFRARGNWQARLAAAAIASNKKFHVVVQNSDLCAECMKKHLENQGPSNAKVIIC